jgi:hypothetical protein
MQAPPPTAITNMYTFGVLRVITFHELKTACSIYQKEHNQRGSSAKPKSNKSSSVHSSNAADCVATEQKHVKQCTQGTEEKKRGTRVGA